MKFLIIGEYANRVIESIDFCEAADNAEWHEGERIKAIIALDDNIIEDLMGDD